MNDQKQNILFQRMKLHKFIDSDTRSFTVNEIKEQILSFYHFYNVIVSNIAADRVFRVRKIDEGDAHDWASDVWHPPADCVKKIGRANDIGETVFYCSLDSKTAIEEGQIEPGDRFSLATYQLAGREPYNFGSVVVREGRLVPGRSHPEELNLFGVELSNFMVKEFTRPVPPGNEGDYKRSCAIAKILFDLPNKDSIIYQSVKNLDAVNIALKSDAASRRLKLLEVATCSMDELGNTQFEALLVPDSDGRLVHHPCHGPVPATSNFSDPHPSFKIMYSDERIATPKEILAYYSTIHGQ